MGGTKASLVSTVICAVFLIPVVAAAGAPLELTGDVLIQNNGPRTVLAYVQPDSGGVTHVLRLSAEKPFPRNPVSYRFSRAAVTIDSGLLTIMDDERRIAVIFALNEAPNPEVAALRHLRARRHDVSDDEPRLHQVVLLRGYWLGYRTLAPGQYLDTVKRDRKQAAEFCDASFSGDDCIDDGGTGGGGIGGAAALCDSGGRGSTQCSCSNSSGGSCSVTCGAGYFACCRFCSSSVPSCSCFTN